MNEALKQRLTGAVVLVILGVIFLPMLLEKPTNSAPQKAVQEIPIAVKQPRQTVQIPPEVLAQYDQQQPELPETQEARVLPSVVAEESPTQLENTPTIQKVPSSTTSEPNSDGETSPSDHKKADKSKKHDKQDAPSKAESTGFEWFIQAGSFSSEANANLLVQRLKTHGFPAFHETVKSAERALYRVRLGPYTDKQLAAQAKSKLEQKETIRALIVRLPKGGQ